MLDYDEFRKPDLRFRVLRLYAQGHGRRWISLKLGLNWQTVNRYIVAWETDHYGIDKEDFKAALRNWDGWN